MKDLETNLPDGVDDPLGRINPALRRKPAERPAPSNTVPPGYERLHSTLLLALEQASRGKGNVRHNQRGAAFEEQPMQLISELLHSTDGMAFQAIKKLREGLHLPDHQAQVNELRGVINYVAGIIIYLENEHDRT